MADSTSDSGSVQSLQAELVPDKKNEVPTRFYTLYSLYPKRKQTMDGVPPAEPQELEDGSLSLNILATNLAAAAETDLRTALSQKLVKSGRQTREENFFLANLSSDAAEKVVPASCYYSLINTSSDPLDFEQISADTRTECSSTNDNPQFVACFISFQEGSLYLFHTELEQYTQGLAPLLDKELLLLSTTHPSRSDTSNSVTSPDQLLDQKELSLLGTGIRNYLEQWPHNVLEYLTRTVQLMGMSVQYLLYSALLNASLRISGCTPQQEEDIRRFYTCCSLSQFLEPLQPEKIPVSDTSDDRDLWHFQPVVVDVVFQPGLGVTFDKKYICRYCAITAEALTAMHSTTDVTKIRELLESFKLKFVRNLNTFKRYLKKAEIDHYALYRSLSFLKVCNCGDLLLRYVKLDAGSETIHVVAALETFIRDVNLRLP
ncbi:hypothetical protein BsWGS_20439 [Bradybaena similaris]